MAKFHVLDAQTLRTGPGALDHFRSHIYTNHFSCLAHLLCREETIQARARTKINDNLSGLQGGKRDWVAASVADRGFAFRKSGEQIRRVEIAVSAAAIIRSAAGSAVLNPFGIMLLDSFMSGGWGL